MESASWKHISHDSSGLGHNRAPFLVFTLKVNSVIISYFYSRSLSQVERMWSEISVSIEAPGISMFCLDFVLGHSLKGLVGSIHAFAKIQMKKLFQLLSVFIPN